MTIDELKDKLPHGSGINGDWDISENADTFTACNFYEPMNENGYYDGIAYFTLIIPKTDMANFELHFNGKDSQYYNRKYALREYLEDTIVYSLQPIN